MKERERKYGRVNENTNQCLERENKYKQNINYFFLKERLTSFICFEKLKHHQEKINIPNKR